MSLLDIISALMFELQIAPKPQIIPSSNGGASRAIAKSPSFGRVERGPPAQFTAKYYFKNEPRRKARLFQKSVVFYVTRIYNLYNSTNENLINLLII